MKPGTTDVLLLPRRMAVALLLATAVGGRPAAAQRVENSRPTRPNIVILLADDLGYGELGCQGNHEIPTPHIDAIAARGIRFTDGYVTAPYCSASRAGLMTGTIQNRFGYEFNPIGARNDDPDVGLPTSQLTLARHLQQGGYTTALIGKWHLGGTARYHPLRRGFDEFFGFLHEGHFYVPPPYRGVVSWLRRQRLPDGRQGRWTSPDGTLTYTTHMHHSEPPYDANNPLLRGGTPVTESAYLTDAWTREAVDFIRRCGDRPFFLCLAYNAVHSPMQAKRETFSRFAHIKALHRRIFAAMLSDLDHSVGEVLGALKAAGIEENTLVFFLSDNGGPTRELTSSNRPLRGGKGDVWEGGIRVPFMVQWPGRLPTGIVYRQPVSSLDLFATCSAAAGLSLPNGSATDSVDLLPFLSGEKSDSPHELLFWRQGRRTALRMGDWKLVRNPRGRDDAGWHLFHLAEDMDESNDLANREPRRLKRLLATWQQLDAQMAPPRWKP